MAKYNVRLTDLATGEVRNMDVEADSPETAVSMFDASKFKATIAFMKADKPQNASQISTPEGNRRAATMLMCFLMALFIGFLLIINPPSSAPFIIGGVMVGAFAIAVLYLLWQIANKK